ncbi:hypothetical protein [Frankia sp. Cppng1_Ct_nod]|uniref:hypothetical protein n=1 Tax=Frankia sp. Cppng1_Ct_nod TaxID=2897162 RepID=UPI00104116A9|nr:hypothetical protein [Frankia sp. Cppng1_Ct_nod]
MQKAIESGTQKGASRFMTCEQSRTRQEVRENGVVHVDAMVKDESRVGEFCWVQEAFGLDDSMHFGPSPFIPSRQLGRIPADSAIELIFGHNGRKIT